MMENTEYQLAAVTNSIQRATDVSRARNEEMFRCVDILLERAKDAEPVAAEALLQAAKEILA